MMSRQRNFTTFRAFTDRESLVLIVVNIASFDHRDVLRWLLEYLDHNLLEHQYRQQQRAPRHSHCSEDRNTTRTCSTNSKHLSLVRNPEFYPEKYCNRYTH
ncbi:hypothetical protein KC19_5G057400 [Ceratodon purpureus]|uniref:Uncharacterized protein n=1 Tax=Ceratodon purpureus TaxID=3225 RepID=A0A8T0HZP1_CERPU|nr:hypothetical protein KC19_5G057400 [Ceratodon purpureus]